MVTILPRGGKTLYDWLDLMQQRPAMYLGQATLDALASFIVGYQTALESHDIQENLVPCFDGFGDFIANLHGTPREAGWQHGLLAAHHGNQSEALTFFFIHLAQFRADEDVFLDQRIAKAFVQEVTLHQMAWRNKYPHFSTVLEKIAPLLTQLLMDNRFYGPTSVLAQLTNMAKDDAALAAILETAQTKAVRKKKLEV